MTNVQVHKHHTGCVNAVALSQDPQHRYLASGGDDTIVRLWDSYAPVTSAPLLRFSGHRANIFSLLFSGDQQHLLSAGLDSDIYLYDYARPLQSSSATSSDINEPLRCYDSHRSSIHRLAWRSDSTNIFFSASDDNCVGMFDTRAPECQGLMLLRSAVHAVSSHPLDANQLLIGGRSGLSMWDVRTIRWTQPDRLAAIV
jgi:WD40 repeat protein